MIIGVPKEIKPQEERVGLTPSGANILIQNGHKVYVQKKAGLGSGFSDNDYQTVGCILLDSIEEIYAIAEMIVKVKEPIKLEYNLVREGQILFTFFHFASSKELTEAMLKSGAICIAYETVEVNGVLPLLIPMSEVAGRMATQQGAKYLEKPQKGYGILLGGIPGVAPANVLVLGGGIAGTQAALVASGMGANVFILDTNLERIRDLSQFMPSNVTPLYSNQSIIEKYLPQTHLVIGSVLLKGAKAPRLISREMLGLMPQGSVMIDIAIDQGGCFETSEPTTHNDPVRVIDGIVHYAVTNMPGAVPFTSTLGLTNATLYYALKIANQGWKEACKRNLAIKKGLNIVAGDIVYKEVAEAFSFKYKEIKI